MVESVSSAGEQNVFDVIEAFLDALGESNKYIRRAMMLLRILSEAGWMRYSEIKKALRELGGEHDISDSRLQELLKNLIKNKLIYKLQGVEKTSYYIISEKGLRIAQAMSIPLPPLFPPHVSYFPASDPFTMRLTALMVDAKAMNRVLSLRGVREKVLEGLGQYEKLLELMLNVAKGDSDDISSVRSRLSMLSKDEKEKLREEFKEALGVVKEVAEIINTPLVATLGKAGLHASAAYSALSAVEERRTNIGIDHIIIYIRPGNSDKIRLVLYRYSTLTVATLLLSTFGLELVKPFTHVLYIEGSERAIGILDRILEMLNEQYKRVSSWNIIAEELAEGVDCCSEQAYEYVFSKEPLLHGPFKPRSAVIIIDEALTRKTLAIDLSELTTLCGERTVVLAKGNVKLIVSKPTTLIELVEGSHIDLTIEIRGFTSIPFTLIFLSVGKKLEDEDIFLRFDSDNISIMKPPILVKRTYGEGSIDSKLLLPKDCSAARFYYDRDVLADPFIMINELLEKIKQNKDDVSNKNLSLERLIKDFLLFGMDEAGIFSCKIKEGVLLQGARGNKININIINSKNIWLKLYVINSK